MKPGYYCTECIHYVVCRSIDNRELTYKPYLSEEEQHFSNCKCSQFERKIKEENNV